MKSIASGRCGLQRRKCYSFSFKHSWERSISKSSAQKTKFITVRHKNNHTLNINVTHNVHNLDRAKPSPSYRSLRVYVDSYSFLHSVVYWASVFTPGTPHSSSSSPVSHIPSLATLIVFGHYFHCSAIVTGSNCSTRSKLVYGSKMCLYEKRIRPESRGLHRKEKKINSKLTMKSWETQSRIYIKM